MSVDLLPPDDSCRLTKVGHRVHWVQMNVSFRGPRYPVKILGVEGNYITFGNDEQVWTRWYHSAEHVANILEFVRTRSEASVKYLDRGSLLWVSDGHQTQMYSLAHEPTGECSPNSRSNGPIHGSLSGS